MREMREKDKDEGKRMKNSNTHASEQDGCCSDHGMVSCLLDDFMMHIMKNTKAEDVFWLFFGLHSGATRSFSMLFFLLSLSSF